MSMIPRPQEIYQHFKGNLYQIITVAEHSETGEKLVIYQALYGDFKVYARELGMFTSPVDRVKYPNATQEYRFERVTPAAQPVYATQPTAQPVTQATYAAQTATQPATQPAAQPTSVTEEGGADLDPLLLEFLDADGYEAKLNILAALHHRITQDMITIMAVASDVEVAEGELEDRYVQLRNCLLTMEKYECNRMR
ncbi:MAG: DUF1653 domain-containing protein [Lachnospiraceae bacterium]|nr:DUF1653 domain-containing protein [Lachnospiraceae bacterium]